MAQRPNRLPDPDGKITIRQHGRKPILRYYVTNCHGQRKDIEKTVHHDRQQQIAVALKGVTQADSEDEKGRPMLPIAVEDGEKDSSEENPGPSALARYRRGH